MRKVAVVELMAVVDFFNGTNALKRKPATKGRRRPRAQDRRSRRSGLTPNPHGEGEDEPRRSSEYRA